ncbi:MAG TPA: hypothetical protein V6D20_05475 [Candidatus Obscuribacterales bacterium]
MTAKTVVMVFALLAFAGIALSILAEFIAPILIAIVIFTVLVVASNWRRW